MRGADIRDDRAGGLDQSGQRSDFSGVIHADFPNGRFGVGAGGENGKWNTDMVVQIPLGFDDAVFRAKNSGGEFLRARLATASGDSEHEQFQSRAPCGSEKGEGFEAVLHKKHWVKLGELFGQHWRIQQGRAGAKFKGLGGEFISVEFLPAKSDVKVTGLNGAGVFIEANKSCSRISAEQFGSRHGGDFFEWKWIH